MNYDTNSIFDTIPSLVVRVASDKKITFSEDNRVSLNTFIEELMVNDELRAKYLEAVCEERELDPEIAHALLYLNTKSFPSLKSVLQRGFTHFTDFQIAAILVMPIVIEDLATEIWDDRNAKGKWFDRVLSRHGQ